MHQLFEKARENMVEGQIRPNRVTDPRLLDALGRVPRERFVPRALQGLAYADEDLPLGNGRFLPEPMVLARLLQALDVKAGEIALDVGCGTGYSCAVLGLLAGTAVGLERDRIMAHEAGRALGELGIVNAAVIPCDDLREGYPQQGPYGVILINGSVPAIPDRIRAQLADGGRLATVLAGRGHTGQAVLVTRRGESFSTEAPFDAAMPTLQGFEQPKAFRF